MQAGDYVLNPSDELMEFLKANNFKHDEKFENFYSDYVIVVNVIDKTYFRVQKYFIISVTPMDLDEFFQKINYRDDLVFRKLHDDDGRMIYEGYTLDYAPYGFGTLYYSNKKKYLEGIFDIKGIKQGKEYYPNGQLKFRGDYALTYGYGYNAPRIGNLYSEDGELLFSGKFEIKRGGVGFPMIRYPSGYKHVSDKLRPKIKYFRGYH